MKPSCLARFGIFRAGVPGFEARRELASEPPLHAEIERVLERAERAGATNEETELAVALVLALGAGARARAPEKPVPPRDEP